jgi:hypothetical protein
MVGRGWLAATPATCLTGALFLLGWTSTPGCSEPTGRQPLSGACTPFTLVASGPADGAEKVPLDMVVSLTFSDFPNPATATLDSVKLSSGVLTSFGAFEVDLITRSIRFRNRNWLWPNLTYLVTVLPALESLTGCAAKTRQLSFRTGDGPADPPVPTPATPTFADILPIFAAHCGGATCHRPSAGEAGCLATPATGLSLCDAEAWASLIDVEATELSAMKRVVPGDASRSYLMRKLIPGGPAGGPIPTTPGHRDPPDAPPLDDIDLRALSDWIDTGAPSI